MQTVIGIFDYTNEAQAAVNHLVSNGFDRNQVDISARDESSEVNRTNDDDNGGFGEGISNFFSSLFGNDSDEATNYSEVGRRGSIVTVHAQTQDEAERAAEILDQYGAVDVDERARQYRSSYAGGSELTGNSNIGTADLTSDRTSYTGTETTNDITDRTNDTTDRSIPIIEENLEVGKRVVQSGGARLKSRIIERPVEESVRLRSERVNVERTSVNRPATSADFDTFREGTIEVTEHKEVPVVGKEARVVEEVSLNKEVDVNEETIRDTVRSTEVDVEKLDTDEELRRRNNLRSTDDNSDLL